MRLNSVSVAMIAFIMIGALTNSTLTFAQPQSNNPYDIYLTDDNGNELTDPLFNNVVFYFDTYTHPDSTVEYRLIAMVTIQTVPANVYIQSNGGQFEIDVDIEGLTSFLADTGIIITLQSGDDKYDAKLNSTNSYHSKFKDGIGSALFDPNTYYKLSITTDDAFSSDIPPQSIQNIEITFHAVTAQGYHLVAFESQGELIESYVAPDNYVIDELPSISRSGYSLEGWYTDQGVKVEEGYQISPEEGDIYAKARWEESNSFNIIPIIIGSGIGLTAVAGIILFAVKRKKEQAPE